MSPLTTASYSESASTVPVAGLSLPSVRSTTLRSTFVVPVPLTVNTASTSFLPPAKS